MENARSTGELNLRVLYLGGGDKRAKRSTSAAGGLRTPWTWKCITKHAKHGECKEHRGVESARLVPWGRGQMRETQQRSLSRRKEEQSRAEQRKEEQRRPQKEHTRQQNCCAVIASLSVAWKSIHTLRIPCLCTYHGFPLQSIVDSVRQLRPREMRPRYAGTCAHIQQHNTKEAARETTKLLP
jgi:hypothetical protein